MVLYAHFNSALFGITFNIYIIIDLKKYTDSWLLKSDPTHIKTGLPSFSIPYIVELQWLEH